MIKPTFKYLGLLGLVFWLSSCKKIDYNLGVSLQDTITPMSLTSAKAVDMMLIFQGGTHRPTWTQEELAPYVTYVDPETKVENWLFDGFLIIEANDGAGRDMVAPIYPDKFTGKLGRKVEWENQLSRQFTTDNGIDALNKLITVKSALIGAPKRKRQVVICLPEPAPGQADWGALDGRTLNFGSQADRLTALKWYIDQIIAKWNTLNPQNLELAGFYWTPETAYISQVMLPTVKSYIRTKSPNFKFYHIPHWGAGVRPDWKKQGFDISYQQPNVFFKKEQVIKVKDAVEYAQKNGMSLEFEFDESALLKYNYQKRDIFMEYYNDFKNAGVWENYPLTYYQDHKAWVAYLNSTDSKDQEITRLLARTIVDRQKRADLLK